LKILDILPEFLVFFKIKKSAPADLGKSAFARFLSQGSGREFLLFLISRKRHLSQTTFSSDPGRASKLFFSLSKIRPDRQVVNNLIESFIHGQ